MTFQDDQNQIHVRVGGIGNPCCNILQMYIFTRGRVIYLYVGYTRNHKYVLIDIGTVHLMQI